tara:strand:- start:1524 stop:3167 length:1644 start_codon:yes stop_codon:yes gene_type:complete
MSGGFYNNTVSPSGGTGTGLTVDLRISWNFYKNWVARWNIVNRGTGYKVGDTVTISRPSGLPSDTNADGTFKVFGSPINLTITKIEDREESSSLFAKSLNPADAIADYVQFPGMETKSHQDGPEHQICYLNEIVKPPNPASYMDLAIGGIRINSAKEWTNFTQLSAYFKKGIKVTDLINGGDKKASNNFVEIAYALLTDEYLGAGKLVGVSAVGDMTEGAKFCKFNDFSWDGVISNKINIREFLYEHATFNLLDFTVIGGKFNLIPAVPYKKDDYKIDYDAKIDIKTLFTDGNIKDLQVSFLSPEERQLFKANVLYRKEKENAFAETKSVMLRLKGLSDLQDGWESGLSQAQIDKTKYEYDHGGSDLDPIEKYDMSGFCTTEEHAVKYAKYILKLRRELDHGLTFKTAPQYCINLAPGDYFKLVSQASHTNKYQNGVITKDGDVISKDTLTGSQDIYWWETGTEGVREATVNFDEKPTLPTKDPNNGVLFTIKNTVTSSRVYKVETISYTEEGLVEISGSHAPLTSTGSLAILSGWDGTENHFKRLI